MTDSSNFDNSLDSNDEPAESAPVTEIECVELASVMGSKYAAYLKSRYFEVSVAYSEDVARTRVVLSNASRSFYYPVECRMDCRDDRAEARKILLFLIDFSDAYFEEFLRDGDIYLPIDWGDFEHDGNRFQMRGQVLNLKIERMANELLGSDAEIDSDHDSKTRH